jgi:aminoglycoside phosphotransferase (APT) family kinase protein
MAVAGPGDAPATLLGEPVVQFERCRWGFTNVTSLATLASGRRVICQRVRDPARAAHIARVTRDLPALLAPAHLRAPHLLAADLHASSPLLVREYIPGEVAATLLETPSATRALADQMGAQLGRLARVPTTIDWLDQTWARPGSLAEAAEGWLSDCASRLAADQRATLAATVARLGAEWIGDARLAHGDFCPVNAIIDQHEVIALVDWELARIAGALFDAAWWGWVVRFHHPERWREAWPRLLAAAGLPGTPEAHRHIIALQRLRCLEMFAGAGADTPESSAWRERLGQTLQW